MTGLLGGVFALLGVFTFGLLFQPLAAIFSVLSLLRGLTAASFTGTAAAILSCSLTIAGFAVSPASPLGFAALPEWFIGSPPATVEKDHKIATATSNAPPATPQIFAVQYSPSERPIGSGGGAGSLPLPPLPVKPEAVPPSSRPAATEGGNGRQPAPEATLPDPAPDKALKTGRPTPLPDRTPESPKTDGASDTAKVDLKPWPTSRTEQTQAIQILLRDLNFYHGTTHGTLGPATRAAIRQFQLAVGEAETGEPSEALFDSLQKKRALLPADSAHN